MQAVSIFHDGRIKAYNALFVMTVAEYLDSIRKVVDKNPYQRKRISSSKTVYALLRDDIVKNCVIPPIVLALTSSGAINVAFAEDDFDAAEQCVKNNSANLLILDGLQRTYTLLDLENGLEGEAKKSFFEKKLRIEVYIGLNRIGILYRMLTLNTGQTPMSLRQQIEILYLDYQDIGLPGVTFVKATDQQHATSPGELNFKETIEGFNSYLERNELPIDRSDLLENIRSLENLAHENNDRDLFKEYVSCLMAFINKVTEICTDAEISAEVIDEIFKGSSLWGRNVGQIFRKSQVMAGFGAALGKLKDFKLIHGLVEVEEMSGHLHLESLTPDDYLLTVNKAMFWINNNTKKIGNAQRMFFQFYFRELFNKESDSYLKLDTSVTAALHKLQSQLF